MADGNSPEPTPGGMVEHAWSVLAGQTQSPPPQPWPKLRGASGKGADAAEIGRLVARGQATLQASCADGVFALDPYRIVVAGLAVALDPLPAHAAVVEATAGRIASSVATAEKRIAAIADSLKHPTLSPEDKKELFGLARAGGYDGTKEGVGDLSWKLQWENLSTMAVLVLAGSFFAFALGQFTTLGEARAIRSEAKAMQSETAAKIAAHWTEVDSQRLIIGFAEQSLRLPPGEAAVLLRWIKANPNPAEAEKDATDVQTDLSGRRYACVHLWLDPQTVPPASHAATKNKGTSR